MGPQRWGGYRLGPAMPCPPSCEGADSCPSVFRSHHSEEKGVAASRSHGVGVGDQRAEARGLVGAEAVLRWSEGGRLWSWPLLRL